MPSRNDNGVVKWSSTSSGLWSDPANWSTGTVPDSATVKVAITASGAGNYDVVLSAPETAGVLRVGSADARLVVNSSLQVHSLEMSQGIVELSAGGTISGGKIVAGAHTDFYAQDGTLTNVAFYGAIQAQTLTLGDVAFHGAQGTGRGILSIGYADEGSSSTVSMLGAALDNVHVEFGEGTLQAAGAARLVIGADTLIDVEGFQDSLGAFIENASGGGIVNLGTIQLKTAGDLLHIDATGFRNEGKIVLDTGGQIDFDGVSTGGALTRVIDSIKNSGGTIALSGTVTTGKLDAGIAGAGGTLSSVRYEGALSLAGSSSGGPDMQDGLTITGGTSFAGKDGAGAGSIAVTDSAALDFAGSATLDNATLTLGSPKIYHSTGNMFNSGVGYLQTSGIGGSATTLTLGRHLVINALGDAEIGPALAGSADMVVNDGTIDVSGFGNALGVAVGNFVNHGRIVIDHNNGLVLDAGTSGAGTFASAAALATIASITRLDGGAGIEGTMEGGTFNHDLDEEGTGTGTLSGVAFQGTLTIGAVYEAANDEALTIADGTTFAGTGGVGRATIKVLTGGLLLQAGSTLDNATIYTGNQNEGARIGISTAGATSSSVTFGANVTIQQTNTFLVLNDSHQFGDAADPALGFVNNGRMNLTYAAGAAFIEAAQFTNNGLILMSSNHDAVLPGAGETAASFINAGRVVITDAQLTLLGNASATNEASGSMSFTSSSSHTASLAGGVTGFTNDGRVSFLGAGSDIVTAGVINAGLIAANATSLTFTGPVTNNGTIAASGQGIAAFKTSLLGTGTLDIAGHGTAALTGAAATQVVDFTDATGALALYTPAAFLGTIAGFAAGDAISLVKTASNGFTFANGVLTVTENGASVASLHFAGSYTQGDFSVITARSGNTVITHS